MEWLSIGEGSMGTNVNLLQRVWLTEVSNLRQKVSWRHRFVADFSFVIFKRQTSGRTRYECVPGRADNLV